MLDVPAVWCLVGGPSIRVIVAMRGHACSRVARHRACSGGGLTQFESLLHTQWHHSARNRVCKPSFRRLARLLQYNYSFARAAALNGYWWRCDNLDWQTQLQTQNKLSKVRLMGRASEAGVRTVPRKPRQTVLQAFVGRVSHGLKCNVRRPTGIIEGSRSIIL
jgi:hypothetical protein